MLRSRRAVPLWAWSVPLLCLLLPRALEAQIPRACTTPEALDSRQCCPLWKGSPCGNREDRGICSIPMRRIQNAIDYRDNWPHAFYDSVCHCFGKYDGFDCGQCLFGFKGPLCNETHVVKRKEITDMTDQERETFLSSMDMAKHKQSERYMILTSNDTTVVGNYVFRNASVYDLYVWSHYYAAQNYAGTSVNAAHEGPAFSFWHRIFLLFMEREIRELTGDQGFYIPYWDWTRTDHCNICTNTYLGGLGPDGLIDSGSRFSKWKTVCPFQESLEVICVGDNKGPVYITRNPGNDPRSPTLPTAEDVLNIMTAVIFDTPPFNAKSKDSFSNKLEGFDIPQDPRNLAHAMHNLVHTYLNGTMTPVPTSANDPIFMVHHAFVDKLAEEWLIRNQNAEYPYDTLVPPQQSGDAYMTPFLPLRRNSFYFDKPIARLGYTYLEHSQMSRSKSEPLKHLTTSETEHCIVNAEEMADRNIEYVFTRLRNIYTKEQDYFQFRCTKGTNPSPVNMRRQCNNGVISLPSCQ